MKITEHLIKKLKSCPFCGGTASILNGPFENSWYIRCDECGARKFVVTNFQKQIIAEWNSRVEG
jgi:Lar family restriction alleviation protein